MDRRFQVLSKPDKSEPPRSGGTGREITVYDKEHIHIQYRFDQEIRNVLEYCSSVPAAETEESAV